MKAPTSNRRRAERAEGFLTFVTTCHVSDPRSPSPHRSTNVQNGEAPNVFTNAFVTVLIYRSRQLSLPATRVACWSNRCVYLFRPSFEAPRVIATLLTRFGRAHAAWTRLVRASSGHRTHFTYL